MRKLRSCGSLVKDMENVISGNVVTCERHRKLISFWLVPSVSVFYGLCVLILRNDMSIIFLQQILSDKLLLVVIVGAKK